MSAAGTGARAQAPQQGGAPQLVRVNGREASEVSVLERALHYGDGLFETIACLAGRPRLLGLHLRRLARGCAALGLDASGLAELEAEVRELAAPAPRTIVKVLLSRGAALARGYAPSGREHATRITLCYAWPADDQAVLSQGVRVRRAQQRLGENAALAGLKHCNRLEQVLARREWSDPDIAEALMFSSSGALISGTMSNVFLVRDGQLLTPRLDRCGVAGVMREAVLGVAATAGIPVQQRRLAARDLERLDELFLTSALTGIRPVRELDGVQVPLGPVTQRLQAQLAQALATGAGLPEGAGG